MEIQKSDIDQFHRAYIDNEKIFARHCDLVDILGCDRIKYEYVARHLSEKGLFQLEGGKSERS